MGGVYTAMKVGIIEKQTCCGEGRWWMHDDNDLEDRHRGLLARKDMVWETCSVVVEQ